MNIELKQAEFAIIQKLLFKECGISLSDNKKIMVESRLFKRVEFHKVSSYADYLKIVQISHAEKNEFLNCLSTNETYFFREENHFNFLTSLAKSSTQLKVWSAATSMGSEAYSIAMILDSHLASNSWEVKASDINTEVLNVAKKGLYPLSWSEKIPQVYRTKYCLKGSRRFENKMLIDRVLSKNINFFKHNLINQDLTIGEFDVIFLRNVLLYFTEETKIQVISNILSNLRFGGYLIISMTETFEDEKIENLRFIKNNIYQKVVK
jgi:chemotaxis protein methyltransferase CheR